MTNKSKSIAYCPDCGAKTGVKDIRHSGNGLRRRRHCFACSYQYSTYEISKEQLHKYQRAVRDLDTVKGVLR